VRGDRAADPDPADGKLEILRQPIGQRILRYASLDDIAIWGVLAVILLDWDRVGRQAGFPVVFAIVTKLFRMMVRMRSATAGMCPSSGWPCALAADWAGLHFMVGAFLAGAVMDAEWFNQEKMDFLRANILMAVMPVFFLSTGLRTNWAMGGSAVFVVAGVLLVASVAASWPASTWPARSSSGGGRSVDHRLAAADQGADHDHFRQHPARQADHHQRDLHRAAADGDRQHHAHRADGGAEVATGGAADLQNQLSELI
jgi:hypothetical protein